MTTVLAAGGGEHELEWVLSGVLLSVSVLLVLAYISRVPYPIWLTLGGAVLGFFPGLPDLQLEPDLVLLLVLPPLLYSAAFFSDLRELRRNVGQIGLLAVGLVLFTTVGIAVLAHVLVGELSWEEAFVLGAVLGPTDPVAASAILSRVGAPRRVVAVLEGESLVNDSTGLIAYKFALAAAVSGTFSLADAAGEFVLSVSGGVAIGLAVGIAVSAARQRIDDAPTETVLSLVTAYFAYLPADAVGASGVVAAVTAGIYLGFRAAVLTTAETRLQLLALWRLLVFALNSILFVLVGLQLPGIVDALDGESASALVSDALMIALGVMAIRFVWVFSSTYVPRWCFPALVRSGESDPDVRETTIVAFTGMRGAVSLAAALAIPDSVPGRDLIVLFAFTTILWTVCVEGLSLPWLMRVLGVTDDDQMAYEENKARMLAAKAAVARVDELVGEDWVRDDTAERVRGMYDFRRRRFLERLGRADAEEENIDGRSQDYQRLLLEILDAQREALLTLRREGRIGDDILRRVEHDLDLEETRLDGGRP